MHAVQLSVDNKKSNKLVKILLPFNAVFTFPECSKIHVHAFKFSIFFWVKSRTSTSAPKAKSQLRHWVQTWPLVGLTHGFDMSWFQNKTGAKSESETLIGAAEQYSLLKAYGIEAVFPNVEVALRIYLLDGQ